MTQAITPTSLRQFPSSALFGQSAPPGFPNVIERSHNNRQLPEYSFILDRNRAMMPGPQASADPEAVRVFISYAWESDEYRTLVKRFAMRLAEDGIDARLDAWHVRSGQTVPEFMSSENRKADKILIVCSPEYRRKAHAMEDGERTTGAGYESMLVSSTLWTGQRSRAEVEVVLLRGSRNESIPDFVSGLEYMDLTDPRGFERNYRELLRRLTGQRERAPERGHLPNLASEGIEPLCGITDAAPALNVERPGLVSFAIDRALPALSRALCWTRKPAEYQAVTEHLRALRGHIENEIAKKNYIPNAAKRVVTGLAADSPTEDPFVRPVHQIIRGLVGRSEGGDSATAQIAAVNRRSRVIRNIVKTLLNTGDPLILLGDPGTGKSLTLQQAAIALAAVELHRVYPAVPLFVRLGEFHRDSHVTAEDVLDYVKESAPTRIRPWIDALDRDGRLVILFDGMDEMSRKLYTEHTEALSKFASSRRGQTKTLFSCRITDFSPSFVHQRLVLLPFDESQIAEYLHRYFLARIVVIEDERWKIKKLAKRLLRDVNLVDASNPFTLWLLCFHFAQKKTWPTSRTTLLEFYLEESFNRKREDGDPQLTFPPLEEAMREWARFAYQITTRNRGSAIPVSELQAEGVLIRVGRLCGVLAESAGSQIPLVRFEHHRLQEYFTARHIRDASPPIDWLDKLDAPRWQETLVNLVLMGSGDEAVGTLASAISSEIEEAPKTPVTPDSELLLADRVELAARIALAGSASRATAPLMPIVVKSVEFLMVQGNPITQMKMMRACIHLPDPQLLTAIRRPLTSQINWLREQALVLLSASEQRGGANLAAEIGSDFANGVLLARIPAYVRAIRTSHQRGPVRSLLLGLSAVMIDLLACAVIGAALYVMIVPFANPGGSDQWLTPIYLFMDGPDGAAATAAIGLLAAIFILRKIPEYVWAAVVGTAVATPVLTLAVPELWRMPAHGAAFFLGVAVALWIFVAPVITLAVALVHFVLVAGYVLVTGSFQDMGGRHLYVRDSWDRCGFGWWTKHKATYYPIGLLAGFGFIGLVVDLISVVFGFINSELSKIHLRAVTFLGAVFSGVIGVAAALYFGFVAYQAIVTAATGVHKFVRHREIRRKTAKVVAIVLAAGLASGLATWIVVIFGALLARAVAIAILLVLMALLTWQSYRAWRFSFGQPYSFGPRSFTESSWRETLSSVDPNEQEYIMSQTTHETLGLNPNQFLTVFQNVQPLIKAEPALSTYWARRADLEQVLKQERRG
jgi:hypothetical protein